MERRKAEVRARLIEQSQSKKKKGFMTPERKKKLRVSAAQKGCVTGGFQMFRRFFRQLSISASCLFQLLLRKKAAEELKKEQERKAAERRRVIDQRCGQPKSIDGLGEGTLRRYVAYSEFRT